jgi:L-ascorbate metabolism protein UlaG (beta-lactamase superfamily)
MIIFFYLLFYNLSSIYSQVPPNDLQITYISNEGFLLRSSTQKVLIDALFTNGYGLWSVPSKEVTSEIMDAKAPFDNINLYLLTHYHGDHCDPVLINDYLSKHKNIPFVASRPSIVFIDGSCFGFDLLKKQFNEMTPEVNQSISKTINNIPVKAFGLKHLSFYIDSIDVEENMFNVSFLFQMDGIKIFHSGDIMKNAFQDYLAKNNKWTDTIDVAFLCYVLFDSGASDLDYIKTTINPKYIVLTHIPPSKIVEWTAKVEQLKARFPNIIFFKNSMDSQTINIANIKNK